MNTIKKTIYHDQAVFIPGEWSWKSINVNHSIGRLKRKKNHKHQIDIGKAFNKGQNPFLIESFLFRKLNRRELCQYDKGHLQKGPWCFTLKIEAYSCHSFQHCTGDPNHYNEISIRNKIMKIVKKKKYLYLQVTFCINGKSKWIFRNAIKYTVEKGHKI